MVRKQRSYALILHNDEINTADDVINTIVQLIGYDHTRASNITYIAHRVGKYRFITFNDKETAKVTQAVFQKHNIKTEIQVVYE